MIQNKVILLKKVQKILDSIGELNQWMEDLDRKEFDCIHELMSKSYPFERSLEDLTIEVDSWWECINNSIAVKSEVVWFNKWDRNVWIEKTGDKITGLNFIQGEVYEDTEIKFNDPWLIAFYNQCIDWSIYAMVENEMERLNKILNLSIMFSRETIALLKNHKPEQFK